MIEAGALTTTSADASASAWSLRWLRLAVPVLAWWLSPAPSNDRDWQPDLAVLPWAQFDGNHVTIHRIRNCDYRTEKTAFYPCLP